VSAELRTLVRAMLGDLRRSEPKRCIREVGALEQRFGPFDAVALRQAVHTAIMAFRVEKTTAALRRHEEARQRGKGRRPSLAIIERLQRRQGLSQQTYEASLVRLEALATKARPVSSRDALRAALQESA
jgi:hypothetical protein